ncbi:RmlC-like cupin domain-containing protein [Chytriomyces sp. MP71]|nr:RmlC-like cupin domain-containing protein [Chytriomyces sp. MP71]
MFDLMKRSTNVEAPTFPMTPGELKTLKIENAVSRPIASIIPSTVVTEGGGFQVKRPFPTRTMMQMDPFLMLDHLGPKYYGPYEFPGAPTHPHRGFETVSYILSGESQHHDSGGHSGIMKPGWVQWMTAGSGVLHDERATDEANKKGQVVEGFQIWVNLSKDKKMKTPRYQDYSPEKIPKLTVTYPGAPKKATAWVNVIAGDAHGTKSIITTESPIALLHYVLQPGAKVAWTVPQEFRDNWNVGVYVASGTGTFGQGVVEVTGGQKAGPADFVLFSRTSGTDAVNAASAVVFSNEVDATEPLSVILMGGMPLDEPIARRGPFVMNTEEELAQAFRDYSSGKFGKIKPEVVE